MQAKYRSMFRHHAMRLVVACSAFLLAGLPLLRGQVQNGQPGSISLNQLSLAELASITVTTVSKGPTAVHNTPAAIYVITQEDLRRSGVTTIPDALRLAPGVSVDQIDSNHWAVGVRGLEGQFSRSVLVLIDGRSVYTTLFAGVFWDAQDTLMEDIDRIEVIRGPGGTIWGANAFNGVINIVTKSSAETHGSLVSMGGGSLDQAIGNFRHGGGNGSTFDYRLSGMVASRSSQFHSDNRQFDDWRKTQFGFRTDLTLRGQNRLTVQGDIYKGESGEQVQVASFSPPSEPRIEGNDLISGGNVLARWEHSFGGDAGLQIQTYFDRTNRSAPHFVESRNTFDIDALYQRNLGSRHHILAGIGGRWTPTLFTQKVPTLSFLAQQTDTIYSTFVQDEFQILPDRLALTVGTKIERNNYTGNEVQPSLRLLWTKNPQESFWLAATRAVRTPSRLDTDFKLDAFVAGIAYLRVEGSPNFGSERLMGYELGHRRLIRPSLYVDLAAFHNEYDDLSILIVKAGQPTVQASPIVHIQFAFEYRNAARGATDGFEIAPDWKPTHWWRLRGSYSYVHVDARNTSGGADFFQTIASYEGSSPRHRITAQSFLRLPGNLEFDHTYRYASPLPAQNVAAYGTADVRLGWHPAEGLEISVAGRNLFQQHHAEFGRSPGPLVEVKRSVYGKLTWTR